MPAAAAAAVVAPVIRPALAGLVLALPSGERETANALKLKADIESLRLRRFSPRRAAGAAAHVGREQPEPDVASRVARSCGAWTLVPVL